MQERLEAVSDWLRIGSFCLLMLTFAYRTAVTGPNAASVGVILAAGTLLPGRRTMGAR